MTLIDVNVLVAAHRADHPRHEACREALDGPYRQGFAWCAHTRNGFLRLVTHPGIFASPTPLGLALEAMDTWLRRPQAELLVDTSASWIRFRDLCHQHHASGNAFYDLHLAALALSHGRDLLSDDAGFARIPGLRWRRP